MSTPITDTLFRRRLNQCFYTGDSKNNQQPYIGKHGHEIPCIDLIPTHRCFFSVAAPFSSPVLQLQRNVGTLAH